MNWSSLPQGRDGCPRCAALEARVRDLEGQRDDLLAVIARLEARVAELEDRLRVNSSNSSSAPSSDPLWAPRHAPTKTTGRPPGGQKGHPGHHRTLLPPHELDAVVEHRPRTCPRCGTPFPPDAPAEFRARHQVAELPPRAVTLTEHRSYACRCQVCGARTTEPIPPHLTVSCAGPRLSAALCYLSGRVHGARRAVEDVADELFGLPLSLGTVAARERELSAALERPCKQVQRHVRRAPAKNVDETAWRRGHGGPWLWVAATPDAACFRVDRGRNFHGLQNLLGKDVVGVICSDRHGLYNHLKPSARAACWAHLERDFKRWAERGGPTARLGRVGLSVASDVLRLWHRFRAGKLSRVRLLRRLRPLRRRLQSLLGWGAARAGCGGHRATGVKAAGFCRNLLAIEPALWTFARQAGVEPTNNHAERMLRPAVTWRKTSFGSRSDAGHRYVERILSAVQTLRLRHRRILDYLADALAAHRARTTPPALIAGD